MSSKKLRNNSTDDLPHFEIGQRIRVAIKNSEISEADFARRIGIDKSTLSKYISGHYAFSYEIFRDVVKFTNCDPGWLLTGDESNIAYTGIEKTKEPEPVSDTTSIDQLIGGTGMYAIGDMVLWVMKHGSEQDREDLMMWKKHFIDKTSAKIDEIKSRHRTKKSAS